MGGNGTKMGLSVKKVNIRHVEFTKICTKISVKWDKTSMKC